MTKRTLTKLVRDVRKGGENLPPQVNEIQKLTIEEFEITISLTPGQLVNGTKLVRRLRAGDIPSMVLTHRKTNIPTKKRS